MSRIITPPSFFDQRMQPALLPLSSWLDWKDPHSDTVSRIWVQMPELPPPSDGYPALVVLDGNATFPIAAHWARVQQSRPVHSRNDPCVIIGIGHPQDVVFDATYRRRHYTPAAPGIDSTEGGAQILLNLLQDVLLTDWIERIPLNPLRLGLYGHSLGGLFVLHTLFTKPNFFCHYYAGSPSIWWNNGYVLTEQQHFVQQHASLYAHPLEQEGLSAHLSIHVGSFEEPNLHADNSVQNTPIFSQRHIERMQITRSRTLVDQLTQLQLPRLRAQFHLLADMNHGDTMIPSLMQAISSIGRSLVVEQNILRS